MFDDLLFLRADECLYNTRVKICCGEIVEVMTAKFPIFNPDGVIFSERTKKEIHAKQWEKQLDEMYGLSGDYKPTQVETPEQRARRRAKKKLKDLILSNEFDYFVTLTLDGEKIDRTDYNAVVKKLTAFLDNRVRRLGLKYIGVAELHKKGGIHFHFLTNDKLKLVDSGTVIKPTGGKPVKIATALRQGCCLAECKTVYNVDDWNIGFSTAIAVYGNRAALSNYVCKYITKQTDGGKIGGRYYYSGGKLERPTYKYFNTDFNTAECDYSFVCAGGEFKIKDRFND